MTEAKVRVVLVDDHPLFIDGIRQILAGAADIELVGVGSSGREAVELVRTHAPDVIVIDLDLPDFSGAEAIRRIKEAGSATNVLVLSAFSHPAHVADAFEAGVIAFLPKTQAGAVLVDTVRRAAKGEGDIPQSFVGPMLRTIREQREQKARSALVRDGLTRRERDVLRELASGATVEDIASRSQLSVHTVRGHVRNILAKLGVHSMGQAIAIAYQSGEMQPSGPDPTD